MIINFEKLTVELNYKEKVKAEILGAILKKGGRYTSDELMKFLNWNSSSKNQVKIRKMIHWLRESGTVPFLLSSSKGYYVSRDKLEIKKCIESLRQRSRSIEEVAVALEKQLDEMEKPIETEQMEIF